jgi:hypothetical protein
VPLRWFLCPVDNETAHDGTIRRWPRIARIVDPSRPPTPGVDALGNPTAIPKTYRFVCAISDGQPGQVNNWCLCIVRSTDFAPLNAALDVNDLLEEAYEDGDNRLNATPNDLGWSAAKRVRVRDRLIAKGVDISGLTADSPLWRWLERVGQRIQPGWHPRGAWVR